MSAVITVMELKRNCPETGCGKAQQSNGLIAWCEQGHVFKIIAQKRKSMLIRAAPQQHGACRSCGAALVWVETRRCARMPMDAGFEVIGREGEGGAFLRVYCDQSHFASCPNAKDYRKGGNQR